MSSSDLIIRRAPATYAGEGAYTADGVAEGQLAAGAGTVIRGRRFGFGAGAVMAGGGSAVAGSVGRRGAAFPGTAASGVGTGGDRSAYGLASLALLQVDLRELHQRIEDRGYAQGHARAEAELARAIEAAGAMAARIEALAPTESTAVAHALVALSTAIAGRIVGTELHLDSAVLVRALESAVAAINGSPEARVLLHPDQLAPVRATWEAMHGSAYLGKRWAFEADASLPPGGCVLRYEHGFVAAGLEVQLELINAALEEAIPGLRPARPLDADEADA